MEGFAYQKYIRVSPKKLTRLISPLRGMSVEEALGVMRELPSPHTRLVTKAIKSAYANLKVKKEEEDISDEKAVIKSFIVEQSFRLKRLNPRAKGRADIILRRFSHLKCVVTDGS